MICRICKNSENNKIYFVEELMFGTGGKFPYFQCSWCGCLQIKEIPANIENYYPHNYYSYNLDPSINKNNSIRNIAARLRNQFAVFNKGILGRVLYTTNPYEKLIILSKINLTKNLKILDVGCGTGSVLYSLKELGFKNLLGIDLYIDQNIEYPIGLEIKKLSIHDINDKWDLIMLIQSFEHMPDPLAVLLKVSKILSKDGICLVNTPTVSSYAWQHYGVNWVNLDAPRHFFLHSIESMKILAKKANLSLINTFYNSRDFQFWGSEQYQKGIFLKAENSYYIDPKKSIFSFRQIRNFKKEAKRLNRENRGDSIAFYMKKN